MAGRANTAASGAGAQSWALARSEGRNASTPSATQTPEQDATTAQGHAHTSAFPLQ